MGAFDMHRLFILLSALALVAAACGGDSSSDTTTTTTSVDSSTTTTTVVASTTTTTVAATTTTEATTTTTTVSSSGPADRPATAVSAVMGADPANETYFAFGTGEYDAAVMGVEPGAATAQWFRTEGFFVVFFDGVDTDATGPTCPGASVATATGFEFVSNAPAEGADCTGFVTLQDDPGVRALQCGTSLAYRTAIPDDSVGILFGTLEKPVGEAIMGITSLADSSAGEIPEVDVSIFEC